MHNFLIAGFSIFSVSASAAVSDSFDCKLNLKRGIHTQAFQLKQQLTPERKKISYPSKHGRNIEVTEGVIPFEIYLNWDKLIAKVTYRHATETDNSGQMFRAAQWKCFESSIETVEGVEEYSCGDKHRTDDPFSDTTQRWRPSEISRGIPSWPEGLIFQESFTSGDDTLTLECKR